MQEVVDAGQDVAAAAGRLLLPAVKIPAASGAKQLEKRFNYLWQAAHASIATCAPVAHQMIATMMQSARLNCVALPEEVLDYVCEHCGGLLVPTVSADVRVVSVTLKAAVNRKLALQRRRTKRSAVGQVAPEVIKNAVRVTCRRCQHARLRTAATVVNKAKSKKEKEKKRALDDISEGVKVERDDEPATKRAKTDRGGTSQGVGAAPNPTAARTKATSASATELAAQQKRVEQQAQPSVLQSLAPPTPPSPPRRLLDGPKRKKKKKKNAAVDPAAVAAKSSLNSFLQSLRPGMSS